MPVSVSVTLTDKEYEDVKVKSKEIGLSVAQYVKRTAIGGDDFKNRYDFLLKKVKELPNDSTFTVKSIFPNWDEISRGIKLSLGRQFYELVNSKSIENVSLNGRTSSNVQVYKIIREEF